MNGLKLLIRADAGPRIGTGHVMRCVALAESWAQRGGSSVFVCGALPCVLQQKIERHNARLYTISNDQADVADARNTIEIAKAESPDWILLDGYSFDNAYQSRIKEAKLPIMAIDDFGHADHRAVRLLLNQNVYASASQYGKLASDCDVLVGPRFALLRSEFGSSDDLRLGKVAKKIPKEAKRILITFGGADPDNWTARTLQVLQHLRRKQLVVETVVGPCYQHVDSLQRLKKELPFTLRVHRNVDRMAPLINSVDMAISAGGTTCYELARCGIPTIIIPIADNQLRVAAKFHALKIGVDLGDHRAVEDKEMMAQIRRMIRSQEMRRDMSSRGQQIVDGKGAGRIAVRLVAGLFSFRQATNSDAETLYRWRNDPEVRAVSFTSNPVPWNDHRDWIKRSLGNSERVIWIAQDQNGKPAGQIRFDIDLLNNGAGISISLDYAYRGKGIGTALIEKATRKFLQTSTVEKVIAQVKPTNMASQLSFRRAGYRPIAPTTIGGQIAHQFACSKRDLGIVPAAHGSGLRKTA